MDMWFLSDANTMKISLLKNKTILPLTGVILLILILWGVFYTFVFIQDVLRGVVKEGGGSQEGVARFELQKARDLGVIPGQ